MGHHQLADVEEVAGAEVAVEQNHGGDLVTRTSLFGGQPGSQAACVVDEKLAGIVRAEAECKMQ